MTGTDHRQHISFYRRPAQTLFLFSIVVCIVLYLLLHPFIGPASANMFGMIPPLVAAGLFGLKIGVITGLLQPMLSGLLLFCTTDIWWDILTRPATVLGLSSTVLVAAALGRIRDVSWLLRKEIAQRKLAQNELNKYHNHLEKLVRERTSELETANRDLEQQITRREHTEKALGEQRERLQAVMQSIGDGVLTIDTAQRLILANPTGREYLSALFGQIADGEVVTHLGGSPVEKLLKEPQSGMPCHEITAREPEQRIFEVAAHPMRVEDLVDGWVLVVRDVTQAREAHKRAESQERLAAVGQLAAGIAHDFNNTLFGIMGYLQLLMRSSNLPREALDRLQKAHEGGEHATKMIQQILDFGRKSPSGQKPVSLAKICENAMELLRSTLPEHIEKHFSTEPGKHMVMANQTQLRQILTNLAVNARDAMPNGGRFSVGLKRMELDGKAKKPISDMPDGRWLILEVSDTGSGIPQEVVPRIFEPFFTTKPPTDGTGLGLAQVYGIVRQHRGYLDVKTRMGEGTSFFIYLPHLEDQSTHKENSSTPPPPAGRGETILLVDDNDIVLKSGQEMLESLGYVSLTARNGKEALQLYNRKRAQIDLIITDIVMPEMGGDELLDALKEQQSQTKVIVLTGYPLEPISREHLDSNVVATAAKPISMKALGVLIQKALAE